MSQPERTQRFVVLEDIPLEDLPGPSSMRYPLRVHLGPTVTENQSPISTVQEVTSNEEFPPVASRGLEIEQDIDRGRYECGICWDNKITRDDDIWYCHTCWSVYHYRCITGVVEAAVVYEQELGSVRWKCPARRGKYRGIPQQFCWCKKGRTGKVGAVGLPPNSCGRYCKAGRSCGHPCNRICHAGDCEKCPQGCLPDSLPSLASSASVRRPPRIRRSSSEVRRRQREARALRDSTHAQEAARASRVQRRERVSLGLPILTVLASIAIALWVYYLTEIVVEPLNHRNIAENNNAVRVLWGCAIFFGFGCMLLNYFSDNSWRRVLGLPRQVPGVGLPIILDATWRLLIFIWITCPLISPIAVPLIARTLSFRGVCDGFDTRITLDIGSGLRTYPVFTDLGIQPHNLGPDVSSSYVSPKIDQYAMAIVCGPPRNEPYVAAMDTDYQVAHPSPSFELNFYDPSYRQVFAIPSAIGNITSARKTTFHPSDQWLNFTLVHYKGENAINPSDVHIGTVTNDQSSPVTIIEQPGFYRVIYDWSGTTWITQIDQKPHEHGLFLIGEHLVFPSLGLQVPNFVDFTQSCKYEPFLKMHRGNGSQAQLERQGREKYRYDGGDVVLRTAAFGTTQGKLEMCARRRDVLDKDGHLIVEGLGDKLPVVAGLIATYRYQDWVQGRRKGCKGRMNRS